MDSVKNFVENLSSGTVLLANFEVICEKLLAIEESFPSKFLVIADFDRTISRTKYDGVECLTTHNYVRDLFPTEDLKKKVVDLQNHYLPIEFDFNVSEEEKFVQMETWWNSVHEIIVSSGITRDDITSNIGNGKIRMRDNFNLFMDVLRDHKIPTIIFSAGILDVVDAFFRHYELMTDQTTIIANPMTFDDSNKIVGFGEPSINTYNKNGNVVVKVTSTEQMEMYNSRPFILLVGDSHGDVNMCNGFSHEHVLKIGFVNNQSVDTACQYLKLYDIVIIGEQTFNVLVDVVTFIKGATNGN